MTALFAGGLRENAKPRKDRRKLLGGLGSGVELVLLGSVLGAELFNAAGFNDTSLSTRVEGVAFRRGIELEERVGLTVDFNRFLRLDRARDDEGLVDRKVDESNLAVFGVNIGFHFK